MNESKVIQQTAHLICKVESIELITQFLRTSFIKACERCEGREMIAAEVGVYEGINARYMLLARENLKLLLVDAWDNIVVYTGGPIQTKEFMRLVKGAAQFNTFAFDNVTFSNKNSEESARELPDEIFDYVYIDGDHSAQAVLRDMRLWYPKVKKGGVLGGHDVGMKEVSSAVEAFVKENNITQGGKEEGSNKSDWWIFR